MAVKRCVLVCVYVLSYVPTADKMNSTVLITQIPRPSSTDQNSHDLFSTESAHVWSSNDRVLIE